MYTYTCIDTFLHTDTIHSNEISIMFIFQFIDLDTEENFDVVDVWQGGRTIVTSHHVSKLSGVITDRPTFISSNNYMIITFSSDSEITAQGFTASWKTSEIMVLLGL